MAHVICPPHRLYLPLSNIFGVVVSVPLGEKMTERLLLQLATYLTGGVEVEGLGPALSSS